MRAIGLFLVLLTSPAFAAGVLPITGTYCGEDLLIDSKGWHGEEECRFTKLTETGPTWFIVSMKCDTSEPGRLRVAISPDRKSIALTDPDDPGEPQRLDACN